MSVYMHMYIYICIVGRIKIQRLIYIYINGGSDLVPSLSISRQGTQRQEFLVLCSGLCFQHLDPSTLIR